MIWPLVWKEWQEQRWKMAFGTVMLLFFTGSLIAARLTIGNENIVLIPFTGGLVLSLYSAMGVFAPEVSNGTKLFLVSKPGEVRKIFFVKWFAGWMNFAAAIIVCGLLMMLVKLLKPGIALNEIGIIVRGSIGGLGCATMYYAIILGFAGKSSGEAKVGLTGLIIFGVIVIHLFVMESIHNGNFEFTNGLINVVLFINPFMWLFFIMPFDGFSKIMFLIVQGLVLVSLMILSLLKWKRS